nr:DUF1963 domain-containing protein [uncultured Chryseobacterium sp.]
MTFPNFLKEFENDLLKYKLDYIKIEATPLKKGQTIDIIQSKFLGIPYLPIGVDYPKDEAGKPMILLAQLNFSEIPTLKNYPEKGILQFYISGNGWYNNEAKVLYHENIDTYQTEFSFLTPDLYSDSPVNCEHSLIFSAEEEYGGSEDFRFDFTFNGLNYWDFENSLNESEKKEIDKFFYNIGHKIGGYAYFTQSDPRGHDQKSKDDVLLLQIDTDHEIMFGDSGVGNFFINNQDLVNKNFEKAYFYWDCC